MMSFVDERCMHECSTTVGNAAVSFQCSLRTLAVNFSTLRWWSRQKVAQNVDLVEVCHYEDEVQLHASTNERSLLRCVVVQVDSEKGRLMNRYRQR